jgi:bacteriorhodopsin
LWLQERAFRFLAIWTLVLWLGFPLLFVLVKSHAISHYAESIAHVVLDFFAKGE